jgi:hypothetical protein
MSASWEALFSSVSSTYQKHAPATPLLDLSLVSIKTFIGGVMILPDSGQVGGSSSKLQCLVFTPSPWTYAPGA